MIVFGLLVGFVLPMLAAIGKVGIAFAVWRLVSEVATAVRCYRIRFVE